MTWVEEEIVARKLKSPAVTLGTAQKHPWLAAMYEKRGYHPFRTALLGRGHTTIYMKKELDLKLLLKD